MSVTTLTCANSFTVGVEDIDYYPFYRYKNKEYSGAAYDILEAFAKKNNYTFTYKGMPITRLLKSYLNGEVDFKFPDNIYWGQQDKKNYSVTYSQPVLKFIDGGLVKPENKGKGIEWLKRLGTLRGFTAWDYLDLIKAKKISLRGVSSLDSLIKQVVSDRLDAAYFNVHVASYYLKHELNKEGVVIFDESLPHTKSNYHLSSIKHAKIINQFNQFLLEEQTSIKKIIEKYELD
ncbi:transporter substrate-binding domain-containing protein [Endozoicomonas sp. SM1973]|uniref:Transporter substrate-binding domain-containing protein n=1 Tax=Spartinivicinus marinus TaxID=2994442 RepID=A0A853I905_9GAMM|nr:transporter substrate-binding domain-containing protein [Spartinivicinus marinus]MCX4025742.1 transporter substrate-binding domain-containing protein [Spartinivicinus marinus]NYZ65735.1 transporter substrate-binding domain-containing protein [Spartinivicinus marinus]